MDFTLILLLPQVLFTIHHKVLALLICMITSFLVMRTVVLSRMASVGVIHNNSPTKPLEVVLPSALDH